LARVLSHIGEAVIWQKHLQSLKARHLPVNLPLFRNHRSDVYHDHPPPHIHAEYQGNKAKIDFGGNALSSDLRSKTALGLVRKWIDLHDSELRRDWELARDGKSLEKGAPLE
jgi:hypothetical protein